MVIGKKPTKPSFVYKTRDTSDFRKRIEQSGSTRDSFFIDSVKPFTPVAGENVIRILPPTWEDPEHFGYDLFVHYNVGPDNASYLCLYKMKGEDCPICEERQRAEAEKEDEEYIKSLRPSKRVAVFLVDRSKEREGAKLWSMSWTIDKDICTLAVDKRTGETYNIDDPDNGYDIEFVREGTGLKTKYTGLQISRRSSELDCDDALQYVVDNPIPSLLNYFSYEHIQKVFSGKSSKNDHENSDTGEETRPAKRTVREPEKKEVEKPTARRPLKKEELVKEQPENQDRTFEDIQSFDDEELLDFISNHDLEEINTLDPQDFDELDDLKKEVCQILELSPVKKTSSTLKERLASLKKA